MRSTRPLVLALLLLAATALVPTGLDAPAGLAPAFHAASWTAPVAAEDCATINPSGNITVDPDACAD